MLELICFETLGLNDIGMERGICDVDAFYWRGQLTETNTKPRPIIITFVRLNEKIKLFRSLYKLNDNKNWKFIYMNDDLTE